MVPSASFFANTIVPSYDISVTEAKTRRYKSKEKGRIGSVVLRRDQRQENGKGGLAYQ